MGGAVDRLRCKEIGMWRWAPTAVLGFCTTAPPAGDGLAVAKGRLVLTTHDGRVLCLYWFSVNWTIALRD